MYERLKEIRKQLNLSQEFVAKQLGLARTTLVAIEYGNRKITADELVKFSDLYGVSIDEILYGKVNTDSEISMFTRIFSTLSEADRKEILNIMDYKRRYKGSVSV